MGRPKGSKNKITNSDKLKRRIAVAKKYKLDRPDTWYKYQVYAPEDVRADTLGYVHFPSKKAMDKFNPVKHPVKPSKLHWIMLLVGYLILGFFICISWRHL